MLSIDPHEIDTGIFKFNPSTYLYWVPMAATRDNQSIYLLQTAQKPKLGETGHVPTAMPTINHSLSKKKIFTFSVGRSTVAHNCI